VPACAALAASDPPRTGPGGSSEPKSQAIRNLDFLKANRVRAMRFYDFYRTVFSRLESLDFQQFALLVIVIVAFGFYCLRGFGSRHDY
jgi:hypothetical protein